MATTVKHLLPDAPSPYFVAKTRFRLYDYAHLVPVLGKGFVAKCCEAVKNARTGVTERTWLDNYVAQLDDLFTSLTDYLNSGLAETKDIAHFTVSNWHDFVGWLQERITGLQLADQTRSKHINCRNKLFSALVVAGALPIKLELEPLHARTNAKMGQSRFTNKGWRRKPKDVTPLGAFEIDCAAHQRRYDYTPYQDIGADFLAAALPVFKKTLASYSAGRAKKLHGAMTQFLRYALACRQRGERAAFFSQWASSGYRTISSVDWETFIYAWRDSLHATPASAANKLITLHGTVTALGLLWQALAHADIVAPVTVAGFAGAKQRASRTPRRSLAQLAAANHAQAVEPIAYGRLLQYFDHGDRHEARQYIDSLCQEMSPEAVNRLTIHELIDAIQNLNDRRLTQLRQFAEQTFTKWHRHWQAGQAALQRASHSADALVDLLDSPLRSVSERRQNSASLLLNGNPEVCLGNALTYVLTTQQGIVTGIQGRYHHLVRALTGNRHAFHGYLHPHKEATLALWVMLLIDTGANCEVVRTMPWNCVRNSSTPGRKQLVLGTKERAGGQRIVDELPAPPTAGQGLSSIQAIALYQEMAQRYHQLATPEAAGNLFTYPSGGRIVALNEWTARAWFTNFIAQYAELACYALTPAMIRPSVLMSMQHRNDSRIDVAQALADHHQSATTMTHYTGRAPMTLHYNLLIREFQERYQAVIIASIDGAATKLGLSDAEYRRILSDAARTGLGVACLNPLAGVQPGTMTGMPCTRQDSCCNCTMRWVVATHDNIADLILFNDHLKTSQASLLAGNTDAWEVRWLPWLVFSDVALAKLAQGETAKIFAEAQKLASQRRSCYRPLPLY